MMLNWLRGSPLDQGQQGAEEAFCKPEFVEPELSIFLSLAL